jgi:hypothetical protein
MVEGCILTVFAIKNFHYPFIITQPDFPLLGTIDLKIQTTKNNKREKYRNLFSRFTIDAFVDFINIIVNDIIPTVIF